MASCFVSAGDFQRHFVNGDAVRAYAKSIDGASQALLTEVPNLRTVNDALRLYHVAAGLRDRLDALCGLALERADELCDAPRVIATIRPETPWGVEVDHDNGTR